MEISHLKSEVMYQPRRQCKYIGKLPVISIDVKGEKQNLKVVEQFKYLGSIIQTFKHKDNNGGECMDVMSKDLRKRIDKGAVIAWHKYKEDIFLDKNRSIKQRIALFNVYVWPHLSQVLGAGYYSEENIRELESFYFQKIKEIVGWKEYQMKSKAEVYKKAGVSHLSTRYLRLVVNFVISVNNMVDINDKDQYMIHLLKALLYDHSLIEKKKIIEKCKGFFCNVWCLRNFMMFGMRK